MDGGANKNNGVLVKTNLRCVITCNKTAAAYLPDILIQWFMAMHQSQLPDTTTNSLSWRGRRGWIHGDRRLIYVFAQEIDVSWHKKLEKMLKTRLYFLTIYHYKLCIHDEKYMNGLRPLKCKMNDLKSSISQDISFQLLKWFIYLVLACITWPLFKGF